MANIREDGDFDVVVIGAGLGGLLSAAQFLRRGQRVAIVERLAHPGGRFTAKTFHGAQVSTGAVHMLPFGTNGELAAMLRALEALQTQRAQPPKPAADEQALAELRALQARLDELA